VPPIRQTNFASGELSPSRWGRTDLAEYAKGARTLLNFFVTRHGEAVSRPGTVKRAYHPATDPNTVRLIPFVYSDTDAYVLVFAGLTIHFMLNGELVMDGMAPLEVVTTYADADLQTLQYIQSGDVLTIAHPDYPPRELRRVSALVWTLEDVEFGGTAPVWKALNGTPTGLNSPMVVDSTLVAADTDHPAREWRWLGTMVCQDVDTGRRYETLPTPVTLKFNGSTTSAGNVPTALTVEPTLYPDRAVRLRISDNSPPFATYVGADKVIAYNFYRGRGLLFGFVGQTVTYDFVDVGSEPDYTIQPPKGDNPFEVFDSSLAVVRTEHPTALCFYQERLAFGATETRPGYLWFSAVGDYYNFDQYDLAPPGSALEFDLFSRRRESVRSMVDLGRLLIFTSSTVRSLPLDADSIDGKVVEEIGANVTAPLVVDGCALYVRNKGQGVRALAPSQNMSGFQGADVSVLAQHLFVGEDEGGTPYEIVEWCYQEDPWGVVWALRNDGVLLSFTFNPQDQCWGWTKHEFAGTTTILSICSIPEGEEDSVYLAVYREHDSGGRVTLERMASRVRLGRTSDDICLDGAVRYSGAPTDTFTGLLHLLEREVWVTSQGNDPIGPYTVDDAGVLELPTTLAANDGSNLVCHIGEAYTCDLETLDVAESAVRTRQKTVKEVSFEVLETFSLKAGQDFDNLVPWDRTLEEGNSPLSAATQLVRVPVLGKWDESARACLRQTQPRPVTVLGITREIDVGD
jgi:hypothetical protein